MGETEAQAQVTAGWPRGHCGWRQHRGGAEVRREVGGGSKDFSFDLGGAGSVVGTE